jgi:hypothetical protein
MGVDSALLAAYLDKTLFHRDVALVDRHLESCARCSAALASLRSDIAAGSARAGLKPRLDISAGVAAVAITAMAAWAVSFSPDRSDSSTPAIPQTIEVKAASAPILSPAASLATSVAAPVIISEDRPMPLAKVERPRRVNAAPAPRSRRRSEAPINTAKIEAAVVTNVPAADLDANARADAGVTLSGRRASRDILWRTRDRVIEHSIDGGATWVAEHTADRQVRAGAFVGPNVAWLVGENGLVLRRTANGWFVAAPPAEGNITAVKASNPSKATVTLEDGRVFTTENGGVTWSAPLQ